MSSSEKVITAYDVAIPEKQEQNLPGLDKKMSRKSHLSVLDHSHD